MRAFFFRTSRCRAVHVGRVPREEQKALPTGFAGLWRQQLRDKQRGAPRTEAVHVPASMMRIACVTKKLAQGPGSYGSPGRGGSDDAGDPDGAAGASGQGGSDGSGRSPNGANGLSWTMEARALLGRLGSEEGSEAEVACRRLWELGQTEPAAYELVVEEGGLPALTSMLSSSKGKEAEEASRLLGSLCKRSASRT